MRVRSFELMYTHKKVKADGITSVVDLETVGTKDKKRKISALSSVSEIELDTSSKSPQAAQTMKSKKKKSKGKWPLRVNLSKSPNHPKWQKNYHQR